MASVGALHPSTKIQPLTGAELDLAPVQQRLEDLEKKVADLESQQKMLMYALIAIVVIYLITK
jgi:hypothetical protein